MRRTGFKKKTLEEVKAAQKSKLEKALRSPKPPREKSKPKKGKKTKKPSMRQLKDKLWAECKRIIREKYPNACYTCGVQGLEGSNWQTGHGKPKGALTLQFQYDIRNLRPQCMRCNVHLGGMQDIFMAKLEQEEDGLAFLEEACRYDEEAKAWIIRRDIPTMGGKDATIFIQNLLEEYRKI